MSSRFIDYEMNSLWEGWISPDGREFPSETGDHCEKALEILRKELGCSEEELDEIDTKATDALMERGWALIHKCGWYGKESQISYHGSLTSEQREVVDSKEID